MMVQFQEEEGGEEGEAEEVAVVKAAEKVEAEGKGGKNLHRLAKQTKVSSHG